MTHLSLTLLGAFQAHLDGQLLTGFVSDKVRALLVYLAVEPGVHSRAQLAGLFWPEWPDATARTYLRHALANLRQILDDDIAAQPYLLVTSKTLQFNPHSNYTVDVVELNVTFAQDLANSKQPIDQVASQALQAAVQRYRQPFLSGFYLNDCAAFEEWVLLTREHIQRQVMEALRLLTERYETTEAYAEAQRYAQRRVELEPWLEEAHRQLMRLLALSGQRSAALAQYETCRRLLATELGVEPSAETTTLYTQIKSGLLGGDVGARGSREKSPALVTLAPQHSDAQAQFHAKHNLPTPPRH